MAETHQPDEPDQGNRLSRRALLQRTAGAGSLLALGGLAAACGSSSSSSSSVTTGAVATGPRAGAGTTLNILTWEGYQNTSWLNQFQKDSGITVNQTSVGAPAEMFAKVQADPSQFDIVFCTAGWFSNYVNDGLLMPIDESRVPNIKLISNVFPWRQATTVKGKSYGVLYNWGDVPLGWLSADVPGSFNVSKYVNSDGKLYDWNVLWDRQFKGKVSMFDSPTDVFPMIGLAAGLKNPYVLNASQLAAVKTKLLQLRPQIKRLTSGFNDQTNQFASGEAIIGYLNNPLVAVDVVKAGHPFGIQNTMKQGTPAWSDNASITTQGGGKKLDAVYNFINYELSVAWQARFIAASGNNGTLSYTQAISSAAGTAGLTSAKLKDTLIPAAKDPAFFPALSFYQTTNVLQQQLDIWNEFKLGIGA